MLVLRSPSAATTNESVRVLLEDQRAAVVNGQAWLHEADYWLYHPTGTELDVVMPKGARVERVTLNGNEVVPLQSAPRCLLLPLSGGSTAEHLQLWWTCEQENLEQPDLTRPRLENVVFPR